MDRELTLGTAVNRNGSVSITISRFRPGAVMEEEEQEQEQEQQQQRFLGWIE